jgi:hypothetical protein
MDKSEMELWLSFFSFFFFFVEGELVLVWKFLDLFIYCSGACF